MSVLRMGYLALAVWGALHHLGWSLVHWHDEGMAIDGLVRAWSANTATTALVWDLTIAAVALTIWIVAEVRVRRNWGALWAIPATFGIGLSCGLPLYLFLRSRPVT